MTKPANLVAQLLAIADEERRFELLAEFVKTRPTAARSEGTALLRSTGPNERMLGADVLGQVATIRRQDAEAIAMELLSAFRSETDAAVLSSIVVALGHAEDPRARGAVCSVATHDSALVRFAVAWALPLLGLDDRSLEILRRLSQDLDDDVRDWVTFGLAESETQDEPTVAALLARSDDQHDDTRAEAILGLARRKHPHTRRLVDRELARPVYGTLIEQARDALD